MTVDEMFERTFCAKREQHRQYCSMQRDNVRTVRTEEIVTKGGKQACDARMRAWMNEFKLVGRGGTEQALKRLQLPLTRLHN